MASRRPQQDDIRKIYMRNNSSADTKSMERAIPKLLGSAGAITFALGLIVIAISNKTNIYSLGLTGIGLLLLLIFTVIDFKAVKSFFTARSTVYSANFVVIIATLFGILVIANAVASNHYVSIDLTENKDFTLSQHTRKVIDQVNSSKRKIEITAFLRKDDERRLGSKIMLEQYSHFSPSIAYKFVDYEISRKIASDNAVNRPCVMLESDGKVFVYDFDEASLTGGIMSLINPQKKIIGMLAGHDELSSSQTGGKALTLLSNKLEKENYVVKSLNIGTDGIPREVSVLVIASPKKPFEQGEMDAIKAYMNSGGAVAFFMEPFQDAGLKSFMESLGVTLDSDMVIDKDSNYFNEATTPDVTSFLTHPITFSFLSDTISGNRVEGLVMPSVTSLKVRENLPEDLNVENVALSSEKSWGETSSDNTVFNGDVDLQGPLAVIVAGSKKLSAEEQETQKKTESRFMVVGDSDMITDSIIEIGNNYNMVLNAINWLSEDEDLMGAREESSDVRMISLNATQAKAIQVINLLIPFAIAGIGIFTWVRKR
jgi:ABC-2 type transport system permease protein